MKAVDPAIETGGPAAARPDQLDALRRFVRAARDHLDFLSYHMYACGPAETPDEEVYDRTQEFQEMNAAIAEMLQEESPDRRIPAHLNEYNVGWSWTTQDPRQTNNKGAVFDALVMAGAASAGVDVTCAWNDWDGVYGKMSADLVLRPAAHVFRLFNGAFVGDVVEAETSDQDLVVPYAVLREGSAGALSMALMNRTDVEQRVQVDLGRDVERPEGLRVVVYRLDEGGYAEWDAPFFEVTTLPVPLPKHSVTVLLFQ
jgi:xylan 1,4-beta-xylosidase